MSKNFIKNPKYKISPNSPFEIYTISCSGRGGEADGGLCNCFANACDDDDDDNNNNILRFIFG